MLLKTEHFDKFIHSCFGIHYILHPVQSCSGCGTKPQDEHLEYEIHIITLKKTITPRRSGLNIQTSINLWENNDHRSIDCCFTNDCIINRRKVHAMKMVSDTPEQIFLVMDITGSVSDLYTLFTFAGDSYIV